MDHIVYLDKNAKELEKISVGEKTMIIRGAAGRKFPYGRVEKNDELYFTQNDGSGLIAAKSKVQSVYNSEKLSKEELAELIQNNQEKLNLTPEQTKRWSGKRYLVLIEIREFTEIGPAKFDRSGYSNMDDWLPVGKIESALIKN